MDTNRARRSHLFKLLLALHGLVIGGDLLKLLSKVTIDFNCSFLKEIAALFKIEISVRRLPLTPVSVFKQLAPIALHSKEFEKGSYSRYTNAVTRRRSSSFILIT